MALRIAVFGQAPFGRDVTTRLAEAGHEIVGVHVPPDDGGRADPLAEEAESRGWPLFRYKGYRRKGEAIRERVEEYLALGADLNVLPFTTVILPPEIVDAPKHRSVCFHPSILPAYRALRPSGLEELPANPGWTRAVRIRADGTRAGREPA